MKYVLDAFLFLQLFVDHFMYKRKQSSQQLGLPYSCCETINVELNVLFIYPDSQGSGECNYSDIYC